MPGFNIEDFKSVITSRDGIVRTHNYMMRFFPPQVLQTAVDIFRDMEMLADQIILPGVNLETGTVRRYGYDVNEKRPLSHTFNDLNVSFIMTGDGDIFQLFHSWITAINPHYMEKGINHESGPYLLSYKDQYITDLNIKIINQVDSQHVDANVQEPISLVVREAFPIGIQDTQFAWSDNNNIARLNIQFTYTDWYLEKALGE